ncbi:hypothetical protein BG003_000983 [Podila horticola]|nr:hypothetical protein BG003_000983 [Podila horticola]
MDIRDQERQLLMVANLSGNTAAVKPQEPQESETHGWGTQPLWVETPAQPAPSKNKNKKKKKSQSQNQRKKKAANQEIKATDLIDAVTDKLSDMTASEDKPAQPSEHDHRHKKDNESNTAHEDKSVPSRQLDHHRKSGKDKNTNPINNNTANKHHNYKNNKGNDVARTSGTSGGSNKKGKGIKQNKEKESVKNVSRDLTILKIENFPPLSSSHLPTIAYTPAIYQDYSVKESQTAKKTKWQPFAYGVTTKLQEETSRNPNGHVPHGDGVPEKHTEPARMKKAHQDGSTSGSTVAPKKAPEEPPLWPKPASIPLTNDKDDANIDPSSIGEASATDTIPVAIVATATSTTTTATTTDLVTPKAKTAPTSPVRSYASILKRPREYPHSDEFSS